MPRDSGRTSAELDHFKILTVSPKRTMSTYKILQVFDTLRQHLREHVSMLECFGRYEFQAEGWLKAEWIAILDQMRTKGHIHDVNREVSVNGGRQKIDLRVDLDDGHHWIEIKHWAIGLQKGALWRPVDSISELEHECEKFTAVHAGNRAWVAALCTKHPGATDWSTAIHQFNRDNEPWRLLVLDDPKNYPNSYYLGVMQVQGLDVTVNTVQDLGRRSLQI